MSPPCFLDNTHTLEHVYLGSKNTFRLSDTMRRLKAYCGEIDVYDLCTDKTLVIDIRFLSNKHRELFYTKYVNEWSLYGYGDLTTATI